MENRLIASSSPHVRDAESTQSLMLDVIIALLPALVASIFYFGFNSMILVISAVVSAVVTEYACQKIMKRPITVTDLSAVVTGILLAFNLPSNAPWWVAVIGSAFAIAIVKQIFGGIGFNFMNPALAGRAFLVASWNPYLTGGFVDPVTDAVASATPLAIIKGSASGQLPSIWNMLLGGIPGVLGETSAILIILGGIYLIYRGTIKWIIPVVYIGTVAVIALLTDGSSLVAYHLFGGGLMLGAFFMATDYATSPITDKGKVIYAIGAGVLTMLIRKIGGYPEGVSYSILLMNIITPMLNKYAVPKVFGVAGGAKNEK
ncbi:RnfABCDGE type electron transport complex subunit D [Sedimentibacter sp.]|uniref:RnfABCDGE type electron transport complex subunit D n=2 Tax=Sedimentibacter sp. TaxID=1960295 RepID=UPI0028AC5BA7|nr:RnfABCDGE type electron transport complex subunit D [Sedimentibacter sp.]